MSKMTDTKVERQSKTESWVKIGDNNNDTEPLLDYEDYFQDKSPHRHSKKGKTANNNANGKRPKKLSLSDQIASQLSNIRAAMSSRPKTADFRQEACETVQRNRRKNRDDILTRRRREASEAQLQHSTGFPVGETDPTIYDLIWRFKELNVVEVGFSQQWRLTHDRKRVAPSVDYVPHYPITEIKRQRL